MRLSDAIRLGAMLKPQAFGDFTDGVGTCAFGAANEALGRPADHEIVDEWAALCRAESCCPCCGQRPGSLVLDDYELPNTAALIVHLNDDHVWTREAIADWVATIEAQHDVPQPVAECAQRKG